MVVVVAVVVALYFPQTLNQMLPEEFHEFVLILPPGEKPTVASGANCVVCTLMTTAVATEQQEQQKQQQ